MMSAYSELYVDDAMKNLGTMIEYATNECECNPDEFWDYFINSGIAEKFEHGNPRFVAGMSGYELADVVFDVVIGPHETKEPFFAESKGREYWAGWALAYYQWLRDIRFKDLRDNGLSISNVMNMYILHEADISKFVDEADKIIKDSIANSDSNLKKIRIKKGITQRELSERSGVSLRMVQLYEQRQNDINKAQVKVVLKLAKTLGCDIEDILELDGVQRGE